MTALGTTNIQLSPRQNTSVPECPHSRALVESEVLTDSFLKSCENDSELNVALIGVSELRQGRCAWTCPKGAGSCLCCRCSEASYGVLHGFTLGLSGDCYLLRVSSRGSPFPPSDWGISKTPRLFVWHEERYLSDAGKRGLREPALGFVGVSWFAFELEQPGLLPAWSRSERCDCFCLVTKCSSSLWLVALSQILRGQRTFLSFLKLSRLSVHVHSQYWAGGSVLGEPRPLRLK